jgi:hypothetical protein
MVRNVRRFDRLASFAALAVALLAAGCASEGSMSSANATATQLTQANYTIVKPGARGTDTGFALLGLIPIVSPSYADAMEDMRSSLPMQGKAISFVNVTQDRSTVYLILCSFPRITISADAIEFTSPNGSNGTPSGR